MSLRGGAAGALNMAAASDCACTIVRVPVRLLPLARRRASVCAPALASRSCIWHRLGQGASARRCATWAKTPASPTLWSGAKTRSRPTARARCGTCARACRPTHSMEIDTSADVDTHTYTHTRTHAHTHTHTHTHTHAHTHTHTHTHTHRPGAVSRPGPLRCSLGAPNKVRSITA